MFKAATLSAALLALAVPASAASVAVAKTLSLVVPVQLSGIDPSYTGTDIVCYLLPMSASEAQANPTAAIAKQLVNYDNSLTLTGGATLPSAALRFTWGGTAPLGDAKSVLCRVNGFFAPTGYVKFDDAKIDKQSKYNPIVVAAIPS